MAAPVALNLKPKEYYAIYVHHFCGMENDVRLITKDHNKVGKYKTYIETAYAGELYVDSCEKTCVLSISIVNADDLVDLGDERTKLHKGRAYAFLNTYYDMSICNIDSSNMNQIETSDIAMKLHVLCPELLQTQGKIMITVGK